MESFPIWELLGDLVQPAAARRPRGRTLGGLRGGLGRAARRGGAEVALLDLHPLALHADGRRSLERSARRVERAHVLALRDGEPQGPGGGLQGDEVLRGELLRLRRPRGGRPGLDAEAELQRADGLALAVQLVGRLQAREAHQRPQRHAELPHEGLVAPLGHGGVGVRREEGEGPPLQELPDVLLRARAASEEDLHLEGPLINQLSNHITLHYTTLYELYSLIL